MKYILNLTFSLTIQNGIEWNPENRDNGQLYTTLEPFTNIPQHTVVSKTPRLENITTIHIMFRSILKRFSFLKWILAPSMSVPLM